MKHGAWIEGTSFFIFFFFFSLWEEKGHRWTIIVAIQGRKENWLNELNHWTKQQRKLLKKVSHMLSSFMAEKFYKYDTWKETLFNSLLDTIYKPVRGWLFRPSHKFTTNLGQ